MNVQNIAELVTSLAVVCVPVIGAYVAKFLKSNKVAATLVSVLSPLAKDAVIAAQKLGVTQYLEGELKKSKAVQFLEDTLGKLNLEADATTIQNAIESAYADLTQDGTLATYTQKTAEEANAETDAEKLAAAKKALADAQTAVTELESKTTVTTTATNDTTTK